MYAYFFCCARHCNSNLHCKFCQTGNNRHSMGNCCDCFGKNDGTGSYLHSPRGSSGGGQRLGTAAEHQQERQRRADEAAAARAAVQDEPERIFDPNLTDSERQRQRELRAQAVEKRSQPKKPKAPASSQEFRNPNNDPNMLQWSV